MLGVPWFAIMKYVYGNKEIILNNYFNIYYILYLTFILNMLYLMWILKIFKSKEINKFIDNSVIVDN